MTWRQGAAATFAAAAGAAALALFWGRSQRLPSQLHTEELVAELSPAPDMPVSLTRFHPGHELRADAGMREAMVTPSPSSLHYRLRVPPHAALRFGVGVQGDGRRDAKTADVRFRVTADGRELFARAVNPAARRRDRRWFDERVDLGAFGDREVEIVLETSTSDPGRRPCGTAGWSHVRVVRDTWRERQAAAPGAWNVLVLLVDTLRADSLGPYGAAPSASPTLDQLAREGLVFENAIAQAPWTMPSVASLLTGVPVRSHGVTGDPGALDDGHAAYLPDRLLTLAEHAAAAGISTVGISANPLVSRATNYAQGFETFEELELAPRDDGRVREKTWATASEVNEAFLRWLRPNRRYRFLAYLHYMEPHHPYTPPARYRPPPPAGIRPRVAAGHLDQWVHELLSAEGMLLPDQEVRYLRRLYDAEVRSWDDALGVLLHRLDELGLRTSTVVLVTADHGEEFQEHGRLMHGAHLYEETLHVPLVIAGPGMIAGRVSELAQGIDLFPTVSALLELSPSPELPGQNLLGARQPRAVVSETLNGRLPDGTGAALVSLRTPSWKLIHAPALGRSELYDLEHDPAEREDRFATAPQAAAFLQQLAALEAEAPPAPPVTEGDRDLRAKLRALGYVE